MSKPLDQSRHQRTCPEVEAKEVFAKYGKKGSLKKVCEWHLPPYPALTSGPGERTYPTPGRFLLLTVIAKQGRDISGSR